MIHLIKKTKKALLAEEFPHLATCRNYICEVIAKEDRSWARELVGRYECQMADFRKRVIRGKKPSINFAIHRHFTDQRSRTLAVLLVVVGRNYEGVSPFGVSRKLIESLSEILDPYKPLKGFIRVRRLNKPGRKPRDVCKFSGNVRAADWLVRDALVALGCQSDFDFSQKTKGRNVLIREVLDQIKAGTLYWWVFDIKSCFASIKHGHIAWCGLPYTVMKNCVYVNKYIHISCPKGADTKVIRSGLALGLTSSGILAGMFIGAKLQQVVGEEVWGGTYVDDGIVSACTPQQLEDAVTKLEESFATDPAGSLILKTSQVVDVDQGFEFLGYWLQRDLSSTYFKIRANPNLTAKRRRDATIHTIATEPSSRSIDDRYEKAMNYALAWRRSFNAIPMTELDKEDALAFATIKFYENAYSHSK